MRTKFAKSSSFNLMQEKNKMNSSFANPINTKKTG